MTRMKTERLHQKTLLRFFFALAAPLSAYAAQSAAHRNPHWIELTYARTAYPLIAQSISFFTRRAPFSIGEFLIAAILAFAVGWITRRIVQFVRRTRRPSVLFTHDAPHLFIALGLTAHFFLLAWGYNYARQPITESFHFHRAPAQGERLESVTRELILQTNECYAKSNAAQTPNGGSALPISRRELYETLEETFRQQPQLGYIRQGSLAPPKPVAASFLMSHANIGGVFSPFTNEPNFNAQQPDCEIPFTVAHEMAHQRGFAFENEANFVAFLVCVRSPNPYIRYSGYSTAARYLLGDLRADPERYRRIRSLADEGPRRDWESLYNFWSQYQGRTSRISQKVNDAYLKANHVESGVANYSEMTGLIIGYFDSNGLPSSSETPANLR